MCPSIVMCQGGGAREPLGKVWGLCESEGGGEGGGCYLKLIDMRCSMRNLLYHG